MGGGGATELEREQKGTRDGEKYKDVKTNGVCERKMRKKKVGAVLSSLSTSEDVWESSEQRVTLVVRKSIDCHSSHYSPSQETKGNKGGGA